MYNQLKSEDRLNGFMNIHASKRWNAVERPDGLDGRADEKEKEAGEHESVASSERTARKRTCASTPA